MQGGQPKYNSWTLLKNYPISIGLWGAHSYNMFWESRGELGSDPAVKQEAYLLRTERYFGGGSRNPVTTRKWQTDRLTTHTTTAGTVWLHS